MQTLLYEKEIILSKEVIEDLTKKLWHVPSEHQHILNMIDKKDMYLNALSGKATTKATKI